MPSYLEILGAMEAVRGGFQSHLAEGESAMLDASAEITEILSVETIHSASRATAPGGSLLIRWRSGRRAEKVCILHHVALELAAAIELESARSNALQAAASHGIDLSVRGLP
jgi:hypothetical protein